MIAFLTHVHDVRLPGARKVMTTGFQKHLEKPVAPDLLVAEVARLAGRSESVASG